MHVCTNEWSASVPRGPIYRIYTGFNIFTSLYHMDLEEMVTLCKYTVPCRHHRIIGYIYSITDVKTGRLGFECFACDGTLVVVVTRRGLGS